MESRPAKYVTIQSSRHTQQYCRTLNGYMFILKNIVHVSKVVWLVGCFGFKGPLRQYFSLYRDLSQREGERGETDR